MSILFAENLTKTYEESFKLGPVSLNLSGGQTVAFLGKNGAGKSTLFQLLTGNIDATNGIVKLNGVRLTPDTPFLKKQIGYLPQKHSIPKWVTGREVLSYAAGLYQIEDAPKKLSELMAYWDCASYANKPLASLSHGMKKRVALALAVMNDPEVLILDEPFSGLDLFQIRALDQEITNRQRAGKLTILSTHIAPYTAKLCQEVYVVEDGNVNLLAKYKESDLLTRVSLIEAKFFGAK